ncbi:hypothetical protein FSC37_14450 [Piscinibacter aquaticus]|uniref:Type 4 fimbrial biogenesis protein PilX N-terminal domain-containing protein n=1 Tax=Piscinibacter aquaticus TaxID=392597 RepID=A0A5C6U0W0_9BURK|nr:hypothetical protein FSC37_14450 [Piscinibacter aquaticus]
MATLVLLSLAAVALVRSVDNSALVIGNLGFKQSATASSHMATERALARLRANASGTTLDDDGAAGTGYFATSQDNLDVTGRSRPRRARWRWSTGKATAPAPTSTVPTSPAPASRQRPTPWPTVPR